MDPRPGIVEHSEPGMAARRVRISREDFEAHGYTESREGCLQLRLWREPKNHNERCRSRMEVAEGGRRRVEAAYAA